MGDTGVERVFLWWEVSAPLVPWLEDETKAKGGHNFWTYDRHCFNNHGVEIRGITFDTARKYRIWKSDKRMPAGLKHLMKVIFGYSLGTMDDLFSRPKPGKLFNRSKVSNSNRKHPTIPGAKLPTVLGTQYQNFSSCQTELIPLDRIAEDYPARLVNLYDYASLDAKATLELEHYINEHFPDEPSVYSDFWNPGLQRWSDMERVGIHINPQACLEAADKASLCADEYRAVIDEWWARTTNWHPPLNYSINWGSPQQLSNFLYNYKNLPIPKVTGGRKSVRINFEKKPSTSVASLDWLMENSDCGKELKTLINWRQCTSDETAVRKLPLFADSKGRIHSVMAPTTDTGRGTSKTPNLLGLTSAERDRFGIRKCFTASPGHKLIVADYSQLELYVLAHYLIKWFGDTRLIDALNSGDVHSEVAKEAWPRLRKYEGDLRQYGPGPSEDRDNTKSIIYGINYGKSASGIGVSIKDKQGHPIGREKAQELINAVMDATGANLFQQRVVTFAEQHGFIGTLAGRTRPLPEIHSHDRREKAGAARQALNSPIQGGAADIVTQAMINLDTGAFPLVLQVHDELVLEVLEERAVEAEKHLVDCMTRPMLGLLVTLKVKSNIVNNWSEAK